jgi:hypothetical protein
MRSLIVFLAALLTACSGGEKQAPPDGGSAADLKASDVPPDVAPLPTLEVTCASCHDIEALGPMAATSGSSWSSWLVAAGQGLVRVDPAIPEPGTHLGLSWPRRGYHPQSALATEACQSCHPVDNQGIGHGIKAYPEVAAKLAFTGGESCGPGCHEWLGTTVAAAPFGDGGPTWQGSADPADLLAAGDNAHTALWQDGYAGNGKGLSLKIGQFRPGCGGCHNLAEESHGAMLSCLHCHRMTGGDGKSHSQHIAIINAQKDQVNPDGPDSACAYCHMEDGSQDVGKAACYNCHLSGHQPLAPAGGAHFW